jgi:hypothetical protein
MKKTGQREKRESIVSSFVCNVPKLNCVCLCACLCVCIVADSSLQFNSFLPIIAIAAQNLHDLSVIDLIFSRYLLLSDRILKMAAEKYDFLAKSHERSKHYFRTFC